jgi:cobalt-zinc-cadmium efflux system protein
MSAHAHSHDHSHHDHAASGEHRLLLAFALTLITLLAEAIGGWWSGSLALLADAGHMLVDAVALLLAWGGAHFSRRPADALRSFGYARLEVLVGYSNALMQFLIVAWIVAEAASRLLAPEPIRAPAMLAIAAAGFMINVLVLRVLGAHDHDDLNTAGARLHVLGDLLGSLGAVIAALAIWRFGWLWADPVTSILVAVLILSSAWKLLRRSAHILLEGTPEDVEAETVIETIRGEAGVLDVHHVHVWQLAGGQRLATLHARVGEGADAGLALAGVQRVLRERFRIAHATVQIEAGDCVGHDCHERDHDHDSHHH